MHSLNTEQHERMFQQAKGITKATSSNHTEHIIINVIQRLHFEQGSENVIASQESQMKSLSKAVGPMENTFMEIASEHYQSHFEHISDYLLCGPGIWWEKTPQGILFLDGSSEKEYQDSGPTLQHFSSLSSSDVELHLLQQWEACCSTGIHLLANTCAFMENVVICKKSQL